MVQYYTLEETAKKLGTSLDDVKQMAKKGDLRPFQDRGTMRFRTQEVDELARRRGQGSDEDLQLGEAPKPEKGSGPSSKKLPKAEPEVFDFTLEAADDDKVEIGQELHVGSSGGGSKKGPGSKKVPGPPSPPPKPGSDSDVRLVADGSDLGFQVAGDSDVKVVEETGPTSSKVVKTPSTKPPSSKRKKAPMVDSGEDSGVRLAGIEDPSDSDVKILPGADDPHAVDLGGKPHRSAGDSDVRLDPKSGAPRKSKLRRDDESMLTEEIDLDAELRQAEEAAKTRAMPSSSGSRAKPKAKPGSSGDLPTVSPFELSSEDLGMGKKNKDSSSDFELAPARDDSSPVMPSSDELPVHHGEQEEVGLGELSGSGAARSGINLQDPADSGISLEQKSGSSDEIEFELSLDEGSTPKPAKGGKGASKEVDSDSEFELTLDDSGGLAPLEEEKSDEEKDIFETDFEVPALDDESGSQAVALDESDTDLESSDFDLALGDEDIASDEESGSQVVALEDEEAEEGAATVSRKRGSAGEDEVEEILGEDEVIEDEAVMPSRGPAMVAAPPAVWHPLVVVATVLCTVVLFVAGLMGFELVRGMWGYRQPNGASSVILRPLAKMFEEKLPEDEPVLLNK